MRSRYNDQETGNSPKAEDVDGRMFKKDGRKGWENLEDMDLWKG